jgi:hypothetical protein
MAVEAGQWAVAEHGQLKLHEVGSFRAGGLNLHCGKQWNLYGMCVTITSWMAGSRVENCNFGHPNGHEDLYPKSVAALVPRRTSRKISLGGSKQSRCDMTNE